MKAVMLSLLAAVVGFGGVVVPSGPVAAATADVDVARYGGADRYATSLLVAEAVADEAGGSLGWAVVVSGERWTDAVVAAPLAGNLGAPVLMTPPGELRADALAFLQRVGVSKALVVGPENAGAGHGPGRGVSATVLDALKGAGIAAERVAGSDRYGTAVAAARRVTPGAMPGLGRTAIVASGDVFADALVAGPFAAYGSHPVLLTAPDSLNKGVAGYLSEANIEHVVLMGGTAALASGVETSIRGLGVRVTRLAGTTRYDTAVKAADLVDDRYSDTAGKDCFATGTIGLARARVPFDSFSAAPLLGRLCAPLVLADPKSVPADTAAYLDRARAANDTVDLHVFGGDAAVSQKALDAYLSGDGAASDDESDDTDDDAPSEYPAIEGPRSNDHLLAASAGRTCMVRPDRTVTCWGRNGLREQLSTSSLTDVVAISSGEELGNPDRHLPACALHADGTVSCWGSGYWGQLGQGDTVDHYMSVKVQGLTDAVSLAVGQESVCAVHRDGGVSCWGDNATGELGDGGDVPHFYFPRRVPGVTDVVAISIGLNATCAVHSGGQLTCWGHPFRGPPQRVEGLKGVTAISIGRNQSCAVVTDGEVTCWNTYFTPRTLRKMPGLRDVVDVAMADGNGCALHRDGGVSCWGLDNRWGQVGDGTTVPRTTPKRLAGISDVIDLSVGRYSTRFSDGSPKTVATAHTCALHRDGRVSCWGGNNFGQVGDGTTTDRLSPTRAKTPKLIPADEVPRNNRDLLLAWVDQEVAGREAKFPWLRAAWDHSRDRVWVSPSGAAGSVLISCEGSGDDYRCYAESMIISDMSLRVIVHELAHVYDSQTGLAPRKAWGAAQLYFATAYSECGPDTYLPFEILADTLTHVVLPEARLHYYETSYCDALPDLPSDEAEQVIRDALAGRVNDWYAKNITDGRKLWAAWLQRQSPEALANLAGEFGGFCDTDWIMTNLDPNLFPAAGTNPFKDGGC
ncbi:cell wall-binding repeat-containing protein [Candidatus Poriferisodalis sp.]|uniref:cell wall-binding repeat-containing protein n=1 Tax=Candidatus Poriferisodalis sp. TaxID=3101277 RepID=UPI003B01EBC9